MENKWDEEIQFDATSTIRDIAQNLKQIILTSISRAYNFSASTPAGGGGWWKSTRSVLAEIAKNV